MREQRGGHAQGRVWRDVVVRPRIWFDGVATSCGCADACALWRDASDVRVGECVLVFACFGSKKGGGLRERCEGERVSRKNGLVLVTA